MMMPMIAPNHLGEGRETDRLEREAEGRGAGEVLVVHHSGQHGGRQQVEHHRDHQREDDRLGQVALGLLGLLCGRAHRVVAEDREEDRGRAGGGTSEPTGEVRRQVVGLDVEEADNDDRQDDGQLDDDQPGLDPHAGLDPAVQQPGHAQAQHDGHDVDHVPVSGARGSEHPVRQAPAEGSDQEVDVLRHTDRDHRHDRGVLQQQVPADEPADRLAKCRVAVGVGRPGLRDHPAELGVGERRTGAGDAGDDERDGDRGPGGRAGVALGHRAREGEDACSDDRAETDRGQLPQADAALQVALGGVVLDRLAPEDPTGLGWARSGWSDGVVHRQPLACSPPRASDQIHAFID